jgi:hypothetical protein
LFGGKRFEDLHGLAVQRCGSVLAALAVAEHVRTGAEVDVTGSESGELTDA